MNFPELCCYINKLKIKQISYEKYENDFMRNIDMNYNKAVQEEYDKLKNMREHSLNILRKSMQNNIQSLKHIKSAVVEKNLENTDLQKLKNAMISFENYTTSLKHQINTEIENLINDELSLTIDITNIEMKLADMNKQDNESNQVSKYSAKLTNDHQLHEEVKEFLTFLNKNGGHDGGWAHEDHLVFLKIFNKIKNKNKLTQSVQTLFPDMTKDMILEHIDWYNRYLKLKMKQKTAIDNWRENKTKKEIKGPEEKKVLQEKKQNMENNIENNKVIKAKVEKWRMEKQQKLEKDLEIQTKHCNKSKDTEKQQFKNQKVKNEVRKWRSAKEAKQQAEILAKEIIYLREKERKMLLANRLIREFQNQDNIYISKRLNKLKINVDPPKSQDQLKKNNISRNPERLLKATKQWLARTSYDQMGGGGDNIFNKHLPLKKIPKLGVPVWRQVVSQN